MIATFVADDHSTGGAASLADRQVASPVRVPKVTAESTGSVPRTVRNLAVTRDDQGSTGGRDARVSVLPKALAPDPSEPDRRKAGGQASGGSFPSRQKLEQMAQRAERRANRELDRLVETLDLTEGQQEVVFEILARSSDHFVPGMITESDFGEAVEPLLESTDSVEEAIEVVLDEDQASEYIEELEEKRAWWWATLRDFIPEEELPDVVEESEVYFP